MDLGSNLKGGPGLKIRPNPVGLKLDFYFYFIFRAQSSGESSELFDFVCRGFNKFRFCILGANIGAKSVTFPLLPKFKEIFIASKKFLIQLPMAGLKIKFLKKI
jgi:hypothetical protein